MDFRKINKVQIAGVTGVVFILALVSSVFFKAPSEQERNPKFEKAAAELLALGEGVRGFYRLKPDYWGLDTQSAINNKIVPESMVKEKRIVNLTGNNVLIGQGLEGSLAMPGAKSFDITYRDVSFDDCAGLTSFAFSQTEALGLLSLNIFNEKGSTDFYWGGEYGLPLKPDDAAKFCGKDNHIMWKYE